MKEENEDEWKGQQKGGGKDAGFLDEDEEARLQEPGETIYEGPFEVPSGTITAEQRALILQETGMRCSLRLRNSWQKRGLVVTGPASGNVEKALDLAWKYIDASVKAESSSAAPAASKPKGQPQRPPLPQRPPAPRPAALPQQMPQMPMQPPPQPLYTAGLQPWQFPLAPAADAWYTAAVLEQAQQAAARAEAAAQRAERAALQAEFCATKATQFQASPPPKAQSAASESSKARTQSSKASRSESSKAPSNESSDEAGRTMHARKLQSHVASPVRLQKQLWLRPGGFCM